MKSQPAEGYLRTSSHFNKSLHAHSRTVSHGRPSVLPACLIPSRAPPTITLQYNNVYPQRHLKVHYQKPTKPTVKYPIHMSSHLK